MRQIIDFLSIAAVVILLLLGNNALHNENQRLRANNEALTTKMLLYRTKHNKSAASVAELRLTISELREQHADAIKEIEALNIKLRRADSYARSISETIFIDTLITEVKQRMGDDSSDMRRVTYDDKWLRIAGLIWSDSLRLEIHSIDTLHQVVHRIPRRFLGIPFGTKYLRQEIVSSNPHTTLIYSEYIIITRKGRDR
ncbi:MAG: hypothetical protein J6R02_02485 [Alistipes sp.]|nr:hypothetical protein [Alistipes sp.]